MIQTTWLVRKSVTKYAVKRMAGSRNAKSRKRFGRGGRRAQGKDQQIGEQPRGERGGDEREVALQRAERGDIDRQDERQRAKEQLPAPHEEEDDAHQDGGRHQI